VAQRQIPERLVNFNVYNGAAALIGMATVDLPSLELMTEEIEGAGIAGSYESPTIGHFKSMSVKLQFRTLTRDALDLLTPTRQTLDIRGSIQHQDPLLGVLDTNALRVECTGQLKGLTPGKLEPGKVMGSELELECAVLRISWDGQPVIEIDKFNMIFKVEGVDQLQKVRRDVGGV
jgi:uncharacterized protein